MTTVASVGGASASIFVPSSTGGALTVAAALSALRLRPSTTVSIRDTAENIQRNLDALQSSASRITGLTASGDTKALTVSAAQYTRSTALLQAWGAVDGQTVDVAGASVAQAVTLAGSKPAWVSGISVSDSATNLQRRMDDLQTLATGGSLRQIVQTGPATALRMTVAQLASRGDALALFRNQAYTLAITDASVAETLGLNGQTSLASNTRIRAIDVKDSTDAIESNLDSLQRLGLRLRTISQTGTDTSLSITGTQYAKNALTIGKIVTPFQLDVMRASAAQSAQLATDRRVVTVTIADSAAKIARSWSLMQRLGDSLSGLQVTDASKVVNLTSAQLAVSETMITRLSSLGAGANDYQLNITGVTAGQALSAAAVDRVASVVVQDSSENLAASFDDMAALASSGKLGSIVLSVPSRNVSLDASRVLGSNATATQSVLDKIRDGRYGLAITGASMTDLGDLSANARVQSISVRGSSAEIASNVDTLFRLGRRVASIRQTDTGEVVTLTQAQFEGRPGVLGKIEGGFRASLTQVSASRAAALAANANVVKISVADTGASIAANWSRLRSLTAVVDSITKTDAGALSLGADDYLAGRTDGLLTKFGSAQRYAITSASVASAVTVAADDAVERIEVSDEGSVVSSRLADLDTLRTGGKLASISLAPGASTISLQAAQLSGAQGVLDLVRGGRYTLSVDEVDPAAVAQLATNAKVASMQVRSDAAGIVAHLDALAGAGQRLRSIVRSDASTVALTLTGTAFERRQTTLQKIAGGFVAELTQVQGARAAALAGNSNVRSLQVTDTAAGLSAAWTSLDAIGAKLASVAQSDSANVQVTQAQWAAGAALAAKWSTPLAVSVSGARVADLASLSLASAVQQVQISDDADTLSAAWSTLAAEGKLQEIEVSDPSRALSVSAATFSASSALMDKIRGGRYTLALSAVDVADVATLAANSRVTSMEVMASAADASQNFDDLTALAGSGRLQSLALSDTDPTLSLTVDQIRNGDGVLERLEGAFGVQASQVSLADLEEMQARPEVTAIAIQDSAANLNGRLADLAELGPLIDSIAFTDTQPVLTLTQDELAAASDALAKASGPYQLDLLAVTAANVQTLDADATVRTIALSDTASRIAEHWSALVAAYNDGSGKLAEIDVSDDGTIALTQAQQDDGAALIAGLLSGRTIATIG